jgi:protein-S-isoprenylcysteine O-methyltransferase Ste14
MSHTPMEHAPVRVLAPVVFALAYAAGALLGRWWPLPAPAAPGRWLLGAALALPGLAIGIAALATMRRAGTSPNPHVASAAMVETGPYRFSRNPMYLSMILIYAGLGCAFRALGSVAVLPLAALAVDRWVIVPEEQYLTERFGDSYAAYRARVRRWI